ncbi:glycogen synthase GlgA [Halochromatium salexigens]|uniref:Glycogen synthase n=1 Tax=Halochromatium salexigens TaxID=49447 RepID=A0AAJ0XGM3_HALSE|nr:glycogen synthase GlgA [Halochromatium salexigens]MBK5932249.1 starch synthase [Halochromatium salexigens]
MSPSLARGGQAVLFASSEAHPLVKTGGLADVASSLPAALRELGHDARLIIPAYPQAKRLVRELRVLSELSLKNTQGPVSLLGGLLPDRDLPVYLVEAPAYFCREGNPYTDVSGGDWGDNPERFLLFARVLARVALGLPTLDWRPDVLHCNDWQTGLAPVFLDRYEERPAVVFTVHNLAYQGVFERATFDRLGLPPALWSIGGVEFHQRMSFLKGGLVFSDRINTVSPTYATEARTATYGCGLDGLLRQLGSRFQGILNGIDYRTWDPLQDATLPQNYGRDSLELKAANKVALQHHFDLPHAEHSLVLGHVGRLVEQKGVDMILDLLPRLLAQGDVQLVMQGEGERALEQRLLEQAAHYPSQLSVRIGYDEARAHLIEAGSDLFLMPSRFEPCGLNQMYSLRYGTVPIVRRTGGLADTVVDTNPHTLAGNEATGFLFDSPDAEALWDALERALDLYHQAPERWRQLMQTGMAQDLSWEASAKRYELFYQEALGARLEQNEALSA